MRSRRPEPAQEGPKELPPGFTGDMVLTAAPRKNLRRRAKAKAGAADGGSDDGAASSSAAGALSGRAGAGALGGGAFGGGGAASESAASGAASLLSSSAFVSDLDRYNNLLGLYVGSSSDDEDDGDYEEGASDDEGAAEAGAEGQEGWPSEAAPAGGGAPGTAAYDDTRVDISHLSPEQLMAAMRGAEPPEAPVAPAPARAPEAPGALPPGTTAAEAVQALVSRMFESHAFCDAAASFLESPGRERLAAAAGYEYPDLVGAINAGDLVRFGIVLERGDARGAEWAAWQASPAAAAAAAAVSTARPAPAPAPVPVPVPVPVPAPAPALAPAFAAAPAPAQVYSAPYYVGVLPAQPAVPAPAPALPTREGGWAPARQAAAEEEEDLLDDLMSLCGITA